MKVLLVYPNDRMDGLISVGISVLSAHLKAANHEVELYDTTFYDTGKKTGDFFREQSQRKIRFQKAKVQYQGKANRFCRCPIKSY